MTLLTEIKTKFAFWAELLERRKTAAEQVVHAELSALYRVLGGLEAQVVLVVDDTAGEVRKLLAEIKRELTPVEAKAIADFDGAIALTKTAAAKLAAEAVKQQGASGPSAQGVPSESPVDATPAAPGPVSAPADPVLKAPEPAAADPAAPAPLVDVSASVTPAAN